MNKIEKQNLNINVYAGEKLIIKIKYDKENDKSDIELFSKSMSYNFSLDGDNDWSDIEYFLLGRIVNCEPEDPILYLKKTKGKLFTDPINLEFH